MKSIYVRYFKKVALIWTGCFVLFFLFYMLMLAPQKNSKEQFRKQLEEKKQKYDYALKATQKDTQEQLNEQIKQLQNRLKDFVVNFGDTANLTFDISQIAGEKAVTSFSIETNSKDSRDQTTSGKYVFESRINVSFSAANFNQFAALLNALERHRPVVFVDRFEITRSDNNNSDRQVKMDLAVFVKKIQDS